MRPDLTSEQLILAVQPAGDDVLEQERTALKATIAITGTCPRCGIVQRLPVGAPGEAVAGTLRIEHSAGCPLAEQEQVP